MADYQKNSFLFLFVFSCLMCCCNGHQFIVGGRDGWVLLPSESYDHWSSRLRFQVNDTLLFKYKQGSDAALVVNKDDYNGCNTNNPIQRLTDGNSVFGLYRSGPFFFIGENKTSCDNGQKLHIVVMGVRHHRVAPSPHASSPAPHGGAPAPSVALPSPSPAATARAPSPVASSPGSEAPDADAADLSGSSFAAAAFSSWVVCVSAVSLVLSMGLGGFISFL